MLYSYNRESIPGKLAKMKFAAQWDLFIVIVRLIENCLKGRTWRGYLRAQQESLLVASR